MFNQLLGKTAPAMLSALILVGCAADPGFETVYSVVTPGTLQPGNQIPPAKDSPIITVTGTFEVQQLSGDQSGFQLIDQLPATESAESAATALPSLQMDRAIIESTGVIEYSVDDPFEGKSNTFRGVLFKDLFEVWQVPDSVEYIKMTALNDYEVKVPVELLKEYPVMLALEQNGKTMTRDYRGPAMLVTPLTQYPDVEELANQEYWIWQIYKIHVE